MTKKRFLIYSFSAILLVLFGAGEWLHFKQVQTQTEENSRLKGLLEIKDGLNHSLESEIENIRTQQVQLEAEVAESRAENSNLKRQIDHFRKHTKQTEMELQSVEAKYHSVLDELDSARSAVLEAEIIPRQLRLQNEQLESHLQQLSQDLQRTESKLSSYPDAQYEIAGVSPSQTVIALERQSSPSIEDNTEVILISASGKVSSGYISRTRKNYLFCHVDSNEEWLSALVTGEKVLIFQNL